MTDRSLERRHAFITLTPEQISTLVAPAFGSNALKTAQPINGGKVNSNYELNFQHDPFRAVLRLYSRGTNICKLERDILTLLSGKINVPHVLYDGSDHETPYLILSFVPGEPLDQALTNHPTNQTLWGADAGTTLANIHMITFPKAGFFGAGLNIEHAFPIKSSGFRAFVDPALTARAGHRLGPDLTAELNALSDWAAPNLDKLPVRTRLIHSDFNPANLRAEGEHISGVIDWEFAHAGEPLTDIANMLRPRAYQSESFNQAFIKAYENIAGVLPKHWQSLSRLIDLMSQIEMLNAPDEQPHLFQWARERVSGTITYINSNLDRS